MNVEAPTKFCFAPHGSICLVVNVEFGRLNPQIIPSWHRPSDEAKKVASALIDLVVDPESGVELVFVDESAKPLNTGIRTSELPKGLHRGGLVAVIGPENLQDLVGDGTGPDPFLWPCGEASRDIY